MCNIFVLILYIKSKQGLPSFLSVCHFASLFIYFLFDPMFASFSLCKLSAYPRGLMRGTDLELSGMSCMGFVCFACNVFDVRLSSAHCITNQCYHGKFKCNHAGLYLRVKVCRLVVQDEIQVKKRNFFFVLLKRRKST